MGGDDCIDLYLNGVLLDDFEEKKTSDEMELR